MRSGRRVRGVEGAKEGDRVGKEEGGLHLDICPGAPSEFLVMPPLTRRTGLAYRKVY